MERRELWWVEAGELGAYLEGESDWPGVPVCGRIRRFRWKGDGTEEGVEAHTWISSAPLAQATLEQVQEWLRGRWGIENRVFWVREVRPPAAGSPVGAPLVGASIRALCPQRIR